MSRPAVVLVSGGLDSATVLALAVEQGFACHAVSFDYGQRHRIELDAAAEVAASGGAVEHVVVPLDLRAIGGSALTDDIDVPKGRDQSEIGEGIPVTYVPARNTIFLSIALGLAEVRGADDLFVGVNAVDYSGYPDCRPEYLEAFEAMANLATRAGVEGHRLSVRAPLLHMSKADIVRCGLERGVDFARTTSCYDATLDGACGACDACAIRLRAFAEVGIDDPAPYRAVARG